MDIKVHPTGSGNPGISLKSSSFRSRFSYYIYEMLTIAFLHLWKIMCGFLFLWEEIKIKEAIHTRQRGKPREENSTYSSIQYGTR